jgi:hypothetical protein
MAFISGRNQIARLTPTKIETSGSNLSCDKPAARSERKRVHHVVNALKAASQVRPELYLGGWRSLVTYYVLVFLQVAPNDLPRARSKFPGHQCCRCAVFTKLSGTAH